MANLVSNARDGRPKQKGHNKKFTIKIKAGRNKMTENRVENYVETDSEREEGHVDTRHSNFECESPDARLGCDPGIDVAG